jgi:hypothetical protein
MNPRTLEAITLGTGQIGLHRLRHLVQHNAKRVTALVTVVWRSSALY